MSTPGETETTWHRVAAVGDLDDGRVMTVTVDRRSLALSRVGDEFGALDNHCPHQGGPLGEGSIENGLLRCPWHGYDYDPLTGRPPGDFSDAPPCFAVETRGDEVWVELPVRQDHERNFSDVLVETLVNWGVTVVFGMVGHSNLGFANAMRRAEERGDLRYIGIRHEGAAAFAASAYGKLTRRPAACFAIAGPGSTNLLTGLYDAKVDGAPVIAISGQVPSSVRGRGAFQDLDLTAAFSDVSVSTTELHAASDPAELGSLAVKHALDGNGVAHLVLPDEIQELPAPDRSAGRPDGRLAHRAVRPPEPELTAAVDAIDASSRPVIIAGDGARGAEPALTALAEHLGAPVLTTFKAKGIVPDTHPLAGGVLGRSGTPVASWLMNECDQLIVVGASFANHTGIAPYKPIVQIDRDHRSIGRFQSVDIGVVGDASVTLSSLADRCTRGAADREDQHADVADRWSLWRAEKRRRVEDDRGHGVSSAAVFDALTDACPPDAVIAVDVGNNTYSFGRYFEPCGQHILMSGYLGSIGFGYPAAMGAWAADPSRPIVAVTGDGGYGQYLAELTTAVKYGMPIRHILLVNDELGKITKEQRAAELEVWQTSLHNPDFAEYATSCGALGIDVRSAAELPAALTRAFAADGPSVVAVRCDAELV